MRFIDTSEKNIYPCFYAIFLSVGVIRDIMNL